MAARRKRTATEKRFRSLLTEQPIAYISSAEPIPYLVDSEPHEEEKQAIKDRLLESQARVLASWMQACEDVDLSKIVICTDLHKKISTEEPVDIAKLRATVSHWPRRIAEAKGRGFDDFEDDEEERDAFRTLLEIVDRLGGSLVVSMKCKPQRVLIGLPTNIFDPQAEQEVGESEALNRLAFELLSAQAQAMGGRRSGFYPRVNCCLNPLPPEAELVSWSNPEWVDAPEDSFTRKVFDRLVPPCSPMPLSIPMAYYAFSALETWKKWSGMFSSFKKT